MGLEKERRGWVDNECGTRVHVLKCKGRIAEERKWRGDRTKKLTNKQTKGCF